MANSSRQDWNIFFGGNHRWGAILGDAQARRPVVERGHERPMAERRRGSGGGGTRRESNGGE